VLKVEPRQQLVPQVLQSWPNLPLLVQLECPDL
jgi:hypothetical protein